jgi:hypothetical protein
MRKLLATALTGAVSAFSHSPSRKKQTERKYNVKLRLAGLFPIGPSGTLELCEFLLC